jgi:hypothetical protein
LKAERLSACASRAERVPAHIEGRACVCICLPVSRVERVYACVCTYQACVCVCLRVLRAGHVSACVCTHWGLRVWLHMFERIESWECVCACWESGIFLHLSAFIKGWRRIFIIIYKNKCWPVSRAKRCTHASTCIKSLACTCMCWFVSGYGRVGQHQELSVILHVSALMKIQSWFFSMCWPVSRAEHVLVCVFTIREPGMRMQVSARIKSSACTSTSWPVLKAEHVSALVGVHSE